MQEEKKLNLFDVFSLGLGGALGSGIFVMLGMGVSMTGRSIVVAVTVGCLYMTLAYLYHVIISSMFVVPGGYYDMQAMIFPPVVTGIGGIFICFSGLGLAMSGLAIVEYAGMIFPGILPYAKIIATIVVTAFFAATAKGSKFVAILGDIMMVILLIAILLFIIMGLPRVQPGYFSNTDGNFFPAGGIGVIQAIALMGFACQGATGAPTSMMVDTIDARKTTPKAILIITVVLALIYGLMSVVAAGVLPLEEVAGQNLSVVAKAIFPDWLYVLFILGGAVLAIATTLLSSIALLSQPCLQVAKDGWLPPVFSKSTKGGYPYVVQGTFYVIALITIFSGFSLDAIVSLVMIPQMLINTYANFALIKFVKQYPEQWKASILHIPMPAFVVVATLGSVCAFLVAFNLFSGLGTVEKITCLGILAICLVVTMIRLKTGAVKAESLTAKRDRIVQCAIETTKD